MPQFTRGVHSRWLPHIILTAFVAVTRLPLFGPFVGEPDSCRYLTGLYLWLAGDRGNHLIYAKAMSAGYYSLMGTLVRLSHAGVHQYALITNGVSICAALLTAPIIFELGRRLTDDRIAFLGSFLFLASPAVWWMGIQPHPQASSTLLCLLSLYACWRGLTETSGIAWRLLSVLSMVGALLMKIDAVLVIPAFYGLQLLCPETRKKRIVLFWTVTTMLCLAVATFLIVRPLILSMGIHQTWLETEEPLSFFLFMPKGLLVVRQALPVVMALGPATFLFVAIGVVLLTRAPRSGELLRWMILIGTWTLVGCGFWFFVAGNVPRHVAVFTLPLIWMGLAGWSQCFGRHRIAFTLVCILVPIINFFTVPPNSSNSHLLSPNVPESALMLRMRGNEIRAIARDVANQKRACFIGTYTIPYLRYYLLEETSDSAPSLGEKGRRSWVRTKHYWVTCTDVQAFSANTRTEGNSRSGYADEMPWSRIYSVEYRPDGSKIRYFGSEVYVSRLWMLLTVAASGSR